MRQVIWKYYLALKESQLLDTPAGARILCVQLQNDQPCLWVLLNLDKDSLNQTRTIEIHGTGNAIPEGRRSYVGTFQQPPFVWHVFERLS